MNYIRTPKDAELFACSIVRELGFADAQLTGNGSDGGIDIVGSQVVAQVKAHLKPIGRPSIQMLHGVAVLEKKQAVFFSMAGYTPQALDWAERAHVALFVFDREANLTDANGRARQLASRAESSASPSATDTELDVESICKDVVGMVVVGINDGDFSSWKSIGCSTSQLKQIEQELRKARRSHGRLTSVDGLKVLEETENPVANAIRLRLVAHHEDGYRLLIAFNLSNRGLISGIEVKGRK